MAVRVEKHEVFHPIRAAFASPNHMMAMPSGDFGYFQVAHRAESLLFPPQVDESSFSSYVPLCFHVKPLLKVRLTSWIKRIRSSLNRNMPLDLDIRGSPQMNELRASFLFFDFSREHPIVCALCCKVFLLHPGRTFSWVSSSCPPPYLFQDRIIHGVQDFTAGPEAMIVCPSSYDRVQF